MRIINSFLAVIVKQETIRINVNQWLCLRIQLRDWVFKLYQVKTFWNRIIYLGLQRLPFRIAYLNWGLIKMMKNWLSHRFLINLVIVIPNSQNFHKLKNCKFVKLKDNKKLMLNSIKMGNRIQLTWGNILPTQIWTIKEIAMLKVSSRSHFNQCKKRILEKTLYQTKTLVKLVIIQWWLLQVKHQVVQHLLSIHCSNHQLQPMECLLLKCKNTI